MDICLRVLKESNISRFDNNSVKNSVLNIAHITFRDCRVHIFSDDLSRNSCILIYEREQMYIKVVILNKGCQPTFICIFYPLVDSG